MIKKKEDYQSPKSTLNITLELKIKEKISKFKNEKKIDFPFFVETFSFKLNRKLINKNKKL